ncbi:alpha/beta hydrolase [Goodfellowiella coeruleoviolacea]|uniref:Acetyl esterase/lipase n=1 Tax=Goodfellowiella coeruleoviolacea TaxID=334858 RepID=A0AAE3GJ94_9PSEU|nr:alpha/beta fold hydrolase [Goodfellowiella coeruleoviolacea]MCP2167158.1 Acetyl esterase/lipase [Goodfellowiella coeruleoviolacea]
MTEDRSVLTRPATAPDVCLRYGTHEPHVADVWFADPAVPNPALAVVVHGGFWRPEYDRRGTWPLADAIRRQGWTVASVEYRRTPGQPQATVADVRLALHAVPELVPGSGRVVVVGHSAGGHLALHAAAVAPAPGLVATVALAPVADLVAAHRLALDVDAVAAFLGGAPEPHGDLDPVRLPTPSRPVVLVHGTEDAIVPIELAHSYAAAHPATRLVSVPGAGHFALIDPLSTAWPTVRGVLADL